MLLALLRRACPARLGAEGPYQRSLEGIMAVFNVANGVMMLFAGSIGWLHVTGTS
jgi:hypothetical protein